MSWFPLLLHLFALGTVGAIVAVPFREIGGYYFRFHTTLALALAGVAVALGRPWDVAGIAPKFALLFSFAVLVQSIVVRARLRLDALIAPPVIGALFVVIAAGGVLPALHLLTAAAMLGTSLVAMTTGHWYLANAALSFDILVRLCRFFALSVAAKAVVVAVYAASRFEAYMGLEDFDKLVMGVRIGAGIVFAMALALMSLSCAKRKANQSATGILYVAVVFVLIGETISIYLTLGKGWPL